MSPYDTTVAVAARDRVLYFEPLALDLNETVRALAASREDECRRRDISITLDLAADLPQTSANIDTIQNVVHALFDYVQTSIQDSGCAGIIAVRTSAKAGRVLCSIGYVQSLETCFETPELMECADAVRGLGGELYAWKPHMSGRVTITMELPA